MGKASRLFIDICLCICGAKGLQIINLSLGTKTPNDSNFEGVKHHLNYCRLEVIFQSLRCAEFVAKGQV